MALQPKRACLRTAGVAGALATIVVLNTAAPVHADAPIPAKAQRATEIRLPKRNVTMPIIMAQEFPFVVGSIAGIPGKLMLDTGIEQALTVNDHRVPITEGRTIGTGYFGSGQTFAIRLVSELQSVQIGSLLFQLATTVQAQDARQLEAITPDFLGWFGHDAWAASHALKIDYDRSRATFEYGPASRYLRNERLIAVLPFQTRKLPNQPLMPGRIGNLRVMTAWDTGQYGTLFTSDAKKQRMLEDGRLSPSREKPGSFDLHGLQINGDPTTDIRGIDVEEGPFPAAAPIGITEPDILTIGYGFLRQYKTMWDYRSRRIYLLARQPSGLADSRRTR